MEVVVASYEDFQHEMTIVTHEFDPPQRYITIGTIRGKRIARKSGYLEAEVEIMRLISREPHPHLIQLLYVDTKEEWLVMEGVKNGLTLYKYYNRLHPKAFTLTEAVEMLGQIASGLEMFHSLNIIHHDLNYDNVLVSILDSQNSNNPGEICLKICDFGLSEVVDGETGHGNSANRSGGTGNWRAPEQLEPADGLTPITTKIDIFPLGLIGNHLVHHGRSLEQNHFSIPMSLLDLLETCKSQKPKDRPTAQEVLVELQKPEMITGKRLADKIITLHERVVDNGLPVEPALDSMLQRALKALATDQQP